MASNIDTDRSAACYPPDAEAPSHASSPHTHARMQQIRALRPSRASHDPSPDAPERHGQHIGVHDELARSVHIDLDLAAVIAAWPSLAEDIRARHAPTHCDRGGALMDTELTSCTDAAALAAAIAHRCPQARQHGDQWQACCPAHDDHTPSLSITPAADKVLVYCHAQCPLDAILAALGLTRRDLFVHGAALHHNGHRRIVTTYDYVDADGVLVHQTVRLTPKAFRQRRPDQVTPGAWIWNLEGIELALYHLPQVIEAIQRGETIYVVEGEKDAEALHTLGLTATCNAMGAGKWRPSYSEALRGASVVVVPDNDPPGHQHARDICAALAGIAARCKLVPLRTDTLHSDVSDWLHAGGTRTALEASGGGTLGDDAPRPGPGRHHRTHPSARSRGSGTAGSRHLAANAAHPRR